MKDFINKITEEFTTPFHNSVLIFSIVLLIILLSPLILRKLKIPSIIGLIISGIAIGPYGFNLLENDSAVKLFSTIGLLYIMFTAGLELDLNEFAKNKHKSFVFGFLTFSLPLTIGFPVCYYILGYDFNASLLVSSMFATHTLVAYPIVSRLGISKSEAVAITVGGTILTDTAVLIILAVISGSATGGLTSEFWLSLGISIAIFLSIVVFIVPRLAAWFFKNLEAEKNSHFIFVLSMVFFCAFLAEMAGLEPIIGAFAAGLALNKLIPHTSALMNRIEFVGNSLFIPFFLISVGMIVDVQVLFNGSFALIVAFTLTISSLLSKWIAAKITGLLMRYNKSQVNLIFGLSSAHAAATLAVILVGYRLKIIDENVLNGTIILILFTCMIASFVTEHSAKKVALSDENIAFSVETSTKEQKILIPISNSDIMERLMDLAVTIKLNKNPYPLVCTTIVDDNESSKEKIQLANKLLEKCVSYFASSDQKVETLTTIDQNVPSGINRVAKETFATDIIIGISQRKSWTDILFGRVMQNIVDQTNQTILAANLTLPLNIHKKIIIILPKYIEKDLAFSSMFETILKISSTLNLSTTFYSSEQTFNFIINYSKNNKLSTKHEFKEFNDWEDFLIIARDIEADDLIFVVLSRKGGIAFDSSQNNIHQKLAKHFKNQSYIIGFPNVDKNDEFTNFSTNYDSSLIEKGVSQISEGAKVITKIFKRDGE